MPSFITISILCSLTVSSVAASTDPIHVSLKRRLAQGLSVNEEVRRLKIKYGFLDPNSLLAVPPHLRRKRASSANIPVTNQVWLSLSYLPALNLDVGRRHELCRQPFDRHAVSICTTLCPHMFSSGPFQHTLRISYHKKYADKIFILTSDLNLSKSSLIPAPPIYGL